MATNYVLAAAAGIGFFLGGFTTAYNLHPDASHFSWYMGGFASLAPYLIGLASKAPWEKSG